MNWTDARPVNCLPRTNEMRIVVTGTRGIPGILGGVETHCEELYPRIVARGHEVYLVRRKCYARDAREEYMGVRLVDIAAPRMKSLEAVVHTFRSILLARKLHADIVHIHAIGPALLTPLARLLGLKVVFTHHGMDYRRARWGRVARAFLRLGERLGCRYADGVIVISHEILGHVVSRYGRRDARLIHNGVPSPVFVGDTSYLDGLGIEPGKYVLSVGRFVPEKNYHHLIRTFSSLGSTCRLVLAGGANMEDGYSVGLERMAKEHGVVLTGFVRGENLHALLTHARCFVLPSSHEGLPIALLEAMSYRLPVIASDIPANLEAGLPVGSYFRSGDWRELSARLSEATAGPLRRQDYPMDAYDWDTIAGQVMEVYEKCGKTV